MKSFLRLVLFFQIASLNLNAQAPQKFSFQAVVRNSQNELITNSSIGVRISILQTNENGPIIYQEISSPNPSTNQNGLISLQIGAGVPISGAFTNINWAAGPYYIKTEFDTSGGANYSITGTSELLSVPYALFSGNNSGGSLPNGLNEGDLIYWNGNAWQILQVGTERQKLTICNGQLKWAPYLPVVTTNANVTNIQAVTASVQGNVVEDGCGSNVSRGFCYSTNPNPTTSNATVLAGQGIGAFQANLTNLIGQTTYYVRAFATNDAGTAYGNQITFQTDQVTLPVISLDSAYFSKEYQDTINLFSFQQRFRGSIINNGGAIDQIGFVWSNTANPDLADNVVYASYNQGSDYFFGSEYIMFNDWFYSNNNTPIILPNTTYYVRAFATNSAGTAYSNQLIIQSESDLVGSIGPGGGRIIYDLGYYTNGWRYLEAAPNDVSTAATWGCSGTDFGWGAFPGVGYGLDNTNEILAACNTPGIAAYLCANYSQNGISDWFLPSVEEVVLFFYASNYLTSIPNISGNYWTSTAYFSGNSAATSFFANGTSNNYDDGTPRNNNLKVRPLRRF